MTCLVPGCPNPSRSPFTDREQDICHAHWTSLPLRGRQEFWRTTDYGRSTDSHAQLLHLASLSKQ